MLNNSNTLASNAAYTITDLLTNNILQVQNPWGKTNIEFNYHPKNEFWK